MGDLFISFPGFQRRQLYLKESLVLSLMRESPSSSNAESARFICEEMVVQ